MKNIHSKPVWETSLNTLAQTGTASDTHNAVIIAGNGSELGNDKVIKGKAKRKLITQKMALSIIDVINRKGETEKAKPYWNTYYCQNRLVNHENRTFGQYCKNRHCTLCCSIRKADIINKYMPVISKWKQPYFVTLTVVHCYAKYLKVMCKGVLKAFRQICEKYRKQNQRGKGKKIMGIKSLECNFNPIKRKYNPHLHIIVPDKETAELLIREWLLKWKSNYTNDGGQNMKRIINLESQLIETVKYGSKIFTEPDVNKKTMKRTNDKIFAAALYNIFNAMKGMRIFDRFGFDLPKGTKKQPAGARIVTNYGEWLYVPQYNDWLNTENELTLSGYLPPDELQNLLANNIDIITE